MNVALASPEADTIEPTLDRLNVKENELPEVVGE